MHRPDTQLRPLAHWALFVQVEGLKVAGVAEQVADVPVAVKLPLLSANAETPTNSESIERTIILFMSFLGQMDPFMILFSKRCFCYLREDRKERSALSCALILLAK